MTLSDELRAVIRAAYPVADQAAENAFSRGALREIYPRYLTMLHQIVRSSVPLMQTTLERLRKMQKRTAAIVEYSDYLARHVDEEAHHDEWLLDDLELIGHNRLGVTATRPHHEIARLVGAQYYFTLHYNPFSLLGYIAVLEGAPPSSAKIDRMEASTGYPSDAFRTLRIHSDVDQEHLRELDLFLDRLVISKGDRQSILANAAFTVAGVARCIATLAEPNPDEHPLEELAPTH